MNQGKRYIRNTVIAMAGVTVLVVVAQRIYASTVDAGTPQWLRSVLSLGFEVTVNPAPSPLAQISQAAVLAELRDFRQISVEGDFAVEVVSAPQYKVSLIPASSEAWTIGSAWQQGAMLRLKGGKGSEGAVLRIEAPVLTRIEAQGLRQLTVRGWKAQEMTIRTKNVANVRLEDSAVGRWILNAETPVVLHADQATAAAGLDFQTSGTISIYGADGKKMVDMQGKGGRVSIRAKK
jgi:hypothetical protein